MDISNTAKSIMGVIIMLTALGGTAFTIDARYAKNDTLSSVQADIQKVETRLDRKILNDRANRLQERIWKYEDRYEDKVMPEDTKEIVRDLKRELAEIELKLKTAVK